MANNNSSSSNPTGTPTTATGLYIEDVQINGSIDGGSAGVAFYLDGGNNITEMRNYGNPSPNPDAVEEFRVETSAFGAQYGQFSAAVVSVITKSGTNQWHGSLFEFNRNTDFNANSWQPAHNAAGQIIVSPYHRNQFGGTVGGPIKKNDAFFFFSYGGLRQITSTIFTGAITPTAAERLGDFTADTFTVYMPDTGKTLVADGVNTSPNCQSAEAELHSPSAAGHDHFQHGQREQHDRLFHPAAQYAGGINPAKGGGAYAGLFPIPVTENEYLGKYDQNLGEKDHVAVTYFFSRNVLGNSRRQHPVDDQSGRLERHECQPQRRSYLQPNHSQPDLAHVHPGSGRTRQPAVHRPGVADPHIVWLELSHPGPGLVCPASPNRQFLRDRDQCRSVHGF